MPLTWDPDTHKENEQSKQDMQALLETKLAEYLAQSHTHAQPMYSHRPLEGLPTHASMESSWRNWVIKTLCGFQSHLLQRFPQLFPEHTSDFLHLYDETSKVLIKVRATNKRKASHK